MSDTCADFESLRRVVKAAGWRRIGVDGVDGAGQSRLAEKLSLALEYPTLDLDDYLHKNQGGYVDFIDYPALSAALSAMPAFILCGVCLRQVLANLGASLDGHVYIQRMRNGLWADEEACVFPEGVDLAIENLARDAATISRYFDEQPEHARPEGDDYRSQFSQEIMHYHDEHLPHEVADLLFERGDDAE